MNLRGISCLADPGLGYGDRDLTGNGVGHLKAILGVPGDFGLIAFNLDLVQLVGDLVAVVDIILGKILEGMLPVRSRGQNSGVLDSAVGQELDGRGIGGLADPGLGHINRDLL